MQVVDELRVAVGIKSIVTTIYTNAQKKTTWVPVSHGVNVVDVGEDDLCTLVERLKLKAKALNIPEKPMCH